MVLVALCNKLTDGDGSDESYGAVGHVAPDEERLDDVLREGEGHDRVRGGPGGKNYILFINSSHETLMAITWNIILLYNYTYI